MTNNLNNSWSNNLNSGDHEENNDNEGTVATNAAAAANSTATTPTARSGASRRQARTRSPMRTRTAGAAIDRTRSGHNNAGSSSAARSPTRTASTTTSTTGSRSPAMMRAVTTSITPRASGIVGTATSTTIARASDSLETNAALSSSTTTTTAAADRAMEESDRGMKQWLATGTSTTNTAMARRFLTTTAETEEDDVDDFELGFQSSAQRSFHMSQLKFPKAATDDLYEEPTEPTISKQDESGEATHHQSIASLGMTRAGTTAALGSTTNLSGGNGAAAAAGATTDWLGRGQKFQVDQSVNLMDADAATYEKRGSNRTSASRSKTKRQSMVDVFLEPMENRRKSFMPSFGHDQKQLLGVDYDEHGDDHFFSKVKTFGYDCGRFVAAIICSLPFLCCVALAATIAIVITQVDWKEIAKSHPAPPPLPKLTQAPSHAPIISVLPTGLAVPRPAAPMVAVRRAAIQQIIMDAMGAEAYKAHPATSLVDLANPTASAHQALNWLAAYDSAQVAVKGNDAAVVSRFAMAALYFATHPTASANSSVLAMNHGAEINAGLEAAENGNVGVRQRERRDLKATAVANKTLEGWMSSQGVCQWPGIECTDSVVVHLNISHIGLQGTLPCEVALLTDLVELDVSNNHLHGSFPACYGSMTKLQFFLAHDNRFQGSLATALGGMTGLHHIDLANNQFEGSLPSEIGKWINARLIMLDENKFAGSLPSSLGALASIEYLYLNNNEFTGIVPFSVFSRLKTILELQLQSNLLEGSIPGEIGSLHRLEVLNLGKNEFTSTLPDIFDRLHYLVELDLHKNSLAGQLPTSMGLLSNLEHLILDNNAFSGAIPDSWVYMTKLRSLVLHHNKLGSSIPDALGSMEQLRDLWLSHNALTGPVPPSIGRLTNLVDAYLESNQLTGDLPGSMTSLHRLRTLRLFENKLTGDVSEICQLKYQYNTLTYISADCAGPEISCACCDKCY